jgi:hypothetical protein
MLREFIVDAIGLLMGGAIAFWFVRRAKGRRAKTGNFDCGFRVISGHHRGLSADWRLGIGTLSPGRVQLENLTIDLLEVDPSRRRSAKLRETLTGADTTIFRVRTDAAELEWSVLAHLADQAIEAVGRDRVRS